MSDYPSTNLRITISPPESGKTYQLVEFDGEFDKAGLNDNRDKIDALLENFPLSYLVFDLTRLRYINSESIGFLMAVHSHLVKLQKGFVLLNPLPQIKDVFNVIGLAQVIPMYDSLEAFLKTLGD